jgi:hypothetical protein
MERFRVFYGRDAYTVLAESLEEAIDNASREYGSDWTKIGSDGDYYTPDQLNEAEDGEETWEFEGDEDEEEGVNESYFAQWDGDVDSRYDIVETLNHFRTEILIEDEDILESLSKFERYDTDGLINEVIESNREGTAVRGTLLGDVFDVLFECQSRKLGNQKELSTLLEALVDGVNSGDFAYDFRTAIKESMNKRDYDPVGWKKFWTEEMNLGSGDGTMDMGNDMDPDMDMENPDQMEPLDMNSEEQKFVVLSGNEMVYADTIEQAQQIAGQNGKIFPAKKAK